MVDALDLESSEKVRESSSLSIRMNYFLKSLKVQYNDSNLEKKILR